MDRPDAFHPQVHAWPSRWSPAGPSSAPSTAARGAPRHAVRRGFPLRPLLRACDDHGDGSGREIERTVPPVALTEGMTWAITGPQRGRRVCRRSAADGALCPASAGAESQGPCRPRRRGARRGPRRARAHPDPPATTPGGTVRTPQTDGRLFKGERRKEELIEATLQVVAREGVAGVSHRAVAREAGLPATAAAYHFASIDDLLTAALTRGPPPGAARPHPALAGGHRRVRPPLHRRPGPGAGAQRRHRRPPAPGAADRRRPPTAAEFEAVLRHVLL
jgi:hypothetical protein